MANPKELCEKLFSLVIFRNLLQDETIKRFTALFGGEKSKEDTLSAYAAFVASLYTSTDNLTDYVLTLVAEDENVYIQNAGTARLTDNYQTALQLDLAALQMLSDTTADEVKRYLRLSAPLPVWRNTKTDVSAFYMRKLENIRTDGYGIWAKHHVFTVKNNKITPVRHPDTQRLSDFSGYARERRKIIENTEALLAGKPCNNVLLYGDAGSGKSSTVKAIANEYKNRGLRLIEVKKSQLYTLPDIMDEISSNPLKFILFIDDLSFSRNDADFSALKAILEGSVNGRNHNIAIYATSNRRHLVKESFSDREGDDLHLQDTIQELTSLSARFGLQITFSQPDKPLYAEIVCDLAKQHGLQISQDELLMKAEAHALRCGGRSPRTAKQFVEYLAYAEKQSGHT